MAFVLETDTADGGKVAFDPLPYLCLSDSASCAVYAWPHELRARDANGRYGALHAKFVVADRNRLFISSANLTEFALNLNIELGVVLTGGQAPEQAAAHIDVLIRDGVLRYALTGV